MGRTIDEATQRDTTHLVRAPDGAFRNAGQLTAAQRNFCTAYVRTGGNAKAAAIEAGYSPRWARRAAGELLQNDRVIEGIHRERARLIQGKGATVAAGTLLELAGDDATPANVRYQAARYLMECAGHGPQNAKENNDLSRDKPLSEMTVEELETFIQAGRQAVEQERRTIDGHVVRADSAPDSEPQGGGGGLTD